MPSHPVSRYDAENDCVRWGESTAVDCGSCSVKTWCVYVLLLCTTTVVFGALYVIDPSAGSSASPSLCPIAELYKRGFHHSAVKQYKVDQCERTQSKRCWPTNPPAPHACPAIVDANNAFWERNEEDYLDFLQTKTRRRHRVSTYTGTEDQQACLYHVSALNVTDYIGYSECVQYFSDVASVDPTLDECITDDFVDACNTITNWLDLGLRKDYCSGMPPLCTQSV